MKRKGSVVLHTQNGMELMGIDYHLDPCTNQYKLFADIQLTSVTKQIKLFRLCWNTYYSLRVIFFDWSFETEWLFSLIFSGSSRISITCIPILGENLAMSKLWLFAKQKSRGYKIDKMAPFDLTQYLAPYSEY